MGRDKHEKHLKNRLQPFVPLLIGTLDSPAWRATSKGAQALYIALKRRYGAKMHNNGKVYLSQRDAAREIRSSVNQVTRWFRELQHYGFIAMTAPGALGVDGKGKAPHWRLTELGCMKEPPTRDFMRWNGVWFSKHQPGGDKPKTESRSGKRGRGVAENRDSTVAENGYTLGNKCSGKQGHIAARGVAENRDISRIPLATSNPASLAASSLDPLDGLGAEPVRAGAPEGSAVARPHGPNPLPVSDGLKAIVRRRGWAP